MILIKRQRLTQDEIIKGDYDMYINVIDATNITRNLFLTVVLLELNLPVIYRLLIMLICLKNINTILMSLN